MHYQTPTVVSLLTLLLSGTTTSSPLKHDLDISASYTILTKTIISTTKISSPITIDTAIKHKGIKTFIPNALTVTFSEVPAYFYLETRSVSTAYITSYPTTKVKITGGAIPFANITATSMQLSTGVSASAPIGTAAGSDVSAAFPTLAPSVAWNNYTATLSISRSVLPSTPTTSMAVLPSSLSFSNSSSNYTATLPGSAMSDSTVLLTTSSTETVTSTATVSSVDGDSTSD